MRMTKVRDVMAGIFAIVLIMAFIVAVMLATGKHVPFISELLGR
jgi:hypothetical protein